MARAAASFAARSACPGPRRGAIEARPVTNNDQGPSACRQCCTMPLAAALPTRRTSPRFGRPPPLDGQRAYVSCALTQSRLVAADTREQLAHKLSFGSLLAVKCRAAVKCRCRRPAPLPAPAVALHPLPPSPALPHAPACNLLCATSSLYSGTRCCAAGGGGWRGGGGEAKVCARGGVNACMLPAHPTLLAGLQLRRYAMLPSSRLRPSRKAPLLRGRALPQRTCSTPPTCRRCRSSGARRPAPRARHTGCTPAPSARTWRLRQGAAAGGWARQ